MAITSWTSEGMDWSNPDPFDPKYWECFRLAMAETYPRFSQQYVSSEYINGFKFRENEVDLNGDLRLLGFTYLKNAWREYCELIDDYNPQEYVNPSTYDGYLGPDDANNRRMYLYDLIKSVSLQESLAFIPTKISRANTDVLTNFLKLFYAIKKKLIYAKAFIGISVYARTGYGSGSSYGGALTDAINSWNADSWSDSTIHGGYFGSRATRSSSTSYSVYFQGYVPKYLYTNYMADNNISCQTDIFDIILAPPSGTISTFFHPSGYLEDEIVKFSMPNDIFYGKYYQQFTEQRPPNPPVPSGDGDVTYIGFTLGSPWGINKYNVTNGLSFT